MNYELQLATAKGKQLQCLELAITKGWITMFINFPTVVLFRSYVRTWYMRTC